MARTLKHLLPLLLLVWVQQFGIAHVAAHSADRLSTPSGAAQVDDRLCASCTVYASLASALPATALEFAAEGPQATPIGDVATSRVAAIALGYRSRAPPVVL